ncbi:MAG TPA: rRNA adenine dimethyltransferase family protein, partial [Candidatus Polarisedimenticolia bacterium]|nr:rRNA adenine dimethyltransferase family protein [Candidatus Polarisedimenticolia bacterium]
MQTGGVRFRPRRRFGQNFLVNRGAIAGIVEAFGPDPEDLVLEIGPGRGALTRALLGRVRALVAVEIDRDLAEALRRDLAESGPAPAEGGASTSVEIVAADILEVDIARLLARLGAAPGRPARVLANLPYNIATAVILRLLAQRPAVRDILVMVQREVAARILAHPGSRAYGSL